MEVELIKADSLEALYEAAGVCRNSSDKQRALEHSIKAGHESILEHCSVTYKITGISRACSHQLVRHRIASFSQQSQRHTRIDGHDWYVVPDSVKDYASWHTTMQVCLTMYHTLLDLGIPAEDARYVLPNACVTDLVMTMNLRSLLNFFNERICTRAQWEIRELATEMHRLIKHIYPVVFKYYNFPNCKECKEKCKNGVY